METKKTSFAWATPDTEPVKISYDPPNDDFYKARISTLERENMELRKKLDKRAEWYGIGRDAFDEKIRLLDAECAKLRDENNKLRAALIREAVRDV